MLVSAQLLLNHSYTYIVVMGVLILLTSNHDDLTIEGSGNIGLQLFSPNSN